MVTKEIKISLPRIELEGKVQELKVELFGKMSELKRGKAQFVDNSRNPDG